MNPIIPNKIFEIEFICKVKTFNKKVEYITWMQLFAAGEICYSNLAW